MSQSGYLLKQLESNQTFPLSKGVTVLGRSPDCDICIDHMHVSREHCIFEQKEASLYLRDLHSTNGTKVNRKPLSSEQKLEVGDEVSLGQVKLKVDFLEENSTVLLNAGERTLRDAMEEIDRLILEDSGGKNHILSAKQKTTVFSIGRSRLCDVILQEVGVSSNHAEIVFDNDRWEIRDLASTNGVFVNGKPVAEKLLKNGDTLLIGKKKLTIAHDTKRKSSPSAKKSRLFFWVSLLLAVNLTVAAYLILIR